MSKVAFWNTADLYPPPENTCEIHISLNDGTRLQKTFQNAGEVFKVLNSLDLEAAFLSRIIWKSKSKFRGDKMLHRLEAVNRGLLNYLTLDIANVYRTFGSKVFDFQKKKVNLSGTVLPTRQMLEWILVRTQGFARLLCYLAHNCEEAAKAWIDPLKRGHVSPICPIVIGMLSRIWAIVKYLIVNSCHWYTELLPFRLILKSVGLRWLPSDYKLPENLLLWLNMPHITNEKKQKVSSSKYRKSDMNLMQFLDMSDDEESEEVKQDLSKQKGPMNFLDVSDEDDSKLVERDESKKKSKMHLLNLCEEVGSKVVEQNKNKKTPSQFLDMSNDLAKVIKQQNKKQKSLVDLLDSSDNEEGGTLPLTATSNAEVSKKRVIHDINDSVDIGQFVSREIKEVPADISVTKKKKLKKKSNMSNREPNKIPRANDQLTMSSTSNMKKKKKFKHIQSKEGSPGHIAKKLKNDKVTDTLTSIKKKKGKKISGAPNTGGKCSVSKTSKAELLEIKGIKKIKSKKVINTK